MKNKRYFLSNILREAEKTERAEDIAYARVYAINFPVHEDKPEGEYKSFYSSEEAAIELIKKKKTATNNVKAVARNIFAAAMACEGRSDRPTDTRWSAYKNDAGETILWDFIDISELSDENQKVYREQHPGASSSIEEDSEIEKKAKKALNNEENYEAYKKVFKDLDFYYSTFKAPTSFVNEGELNIPVNLDHDLKILKFQRDKNPEDIVKKKAYRYVAAIKILQTSGKLPKKK